MIEKWQSASDIAGHAGTLPIDLSNVLLRKRNAYDLDTGLVPNYSLLSLIVFP